ncbi:MAG TPA: LysM peptidoglycan-binding domain-containing protein [Syntrophales bacterium]|nr:LysM peptidoglycan-binding domain-containing protein [Syntrophales bacterium]HOM06668.1 LysM peptidoglycan-binding domain-containing protein [Syntrophales bacterium]HOO00144.1 LysM peptidoglycan-binding domain-containing protein [Syntrophales bacterium]HPC01923.1 LysM peptidoglycan-binding domain-containing protein [Syntrophales bacterium]HPQ06329.1 LysM peptidoglycan-binding domain-containing protein [Syntrophales bacterium]
MGDSLRAEGASKSAPAAGEKQGVAAGTEKRAGKRFAARDEQEIMEQALALLDASREYWEQGNVENALEMLDQAYSLIIETNGDQAVSRQKDDLRLLISKRILAIYSAMQTKTKGKRGEIPLVMNADVEREIRSFQGVERDFFIAAYQRSFTYRPMILKELKKAGLPEELSWLPLVESGFKITALSRARALGLWQFIPSTGYKYGLDRDDWIDERMDWEKSTRAAIAYLRELHDMFGDWLTVLAAYNCGEGRVMRVISGQHINYLDRFWDLYQRLPYETARYVPRFLATLFIIRDPKKYGLDLGGEPQPLFPMMYETVKTGKPMRLEDIAARLAVSEETLHGLNPELRHKITPEREYTLRLPVGTGEAFAKVVDEIPRWEKPLPVPKERPVLVVHRVKRGETVEVLARKYGVSQNAIRKYNHLGKKVALKTGQAVKIPISPSRDTRRAAVKGGGEKPAPEARAYYRVKRGDTLASIAKRHDTTVAELKRINKLKGERVVVGQTLQLAARDLERKDDVAKERRKGGGKGAQTADVKKATKTYLVKKGDTLAKISRRHDVSIARLRELNGIRKGDELLKVGQVIVVE